MIRKIYYFITGQQDKFRFEHKIFNLTVFVLSLFTIQAALLNYFLHLHPFTIWLSLFGTMVTVFAFYFSRLRGIFNTFSLMSLVILTVIIIAPLYFFNGASLGPIIYLFIMLMNIFLLIAPSGYQFKIYGFYTFFVILLLLAELRFPHWTTPYQTPYQRIADHISVLIYSLFFTTVVIYLFRRSYNAEQQLIRSQKKELEFAYKEATEKNRYIQSLILELHHRVKNNLQVVSSLMALQATRSLDKNTKLALEDGRKRIEVMALVHQRLYLSSELSSVPIKSYLQDLALSLSESFGYELGFIKLEFDLSDEPISIDIAIPVGLIFNELVTNAFKHAFKNIKNPLLVVKLEDANNGGLLLTVADNGIGLNLAQAKKQINTFGTKLVELLVKQLHGELILENKSGLTAKILINRYGKN